LVAEEEKIDLKSIRARTLFNTAGSHFGDADDHIIIKENAGMVEEQSSLMD
jgi:hypothetical protein